MAISGVGLVEMLKTVGICTDKAIEVLLTATSEEGIERTQILTQPMQSNDSY